MDILRLLLRIVRHRGEGPHRRRLKLTCAISNPSTTPVCILSTWMTVRTSDGLTLDEGTLFHMEHALAYPPVLRQGQEGTGVITVDLPSPVLSALEQRRRGGDVELRVSARVLVCQVLGNEEEGAFAWPVQSLFESGMSGEVEHTIPQSEWIRLLREMEWSEIQLFELPSRDLRSDARLARAVKRLEEAQDCHRRGLWAESVANCRKVFEAVVKDVSGQDSMDQALDVIRSFVPDTVKAERVNEIVVALTSFLHLARHEKLPEIDITPADSMFALQMSTGVLAYLASR